MKSLQIAASIIASVTAVAALAQGPPIQHCTYTTTSCIPFHTPLGVYEVTEYATPFTETVSHTYNCQGCAAVTVVPKDCFGVGPVDRTTTTVVRAEKTVTTDVCAPTL